MAERREMLGPYAYVWDEGCFPLGRDTLALGEFASPRRNGRVCDLGCGAGALLLLALGREPSLTAVGIERDPHAGALARRNLADNGLRGEIIVGDLSDRAVLPSAGAFDLVLSNPPYFAAGSGGNGGSARMEESCTLEALCASAAYLLKNRGRFALVHRPERLCDLFCALRGAGLEPKRMKLLAVSGKAPSAVLVEAARQGRPGLKIEP